MRTEKAKFPMLMRFVLANKVEKAEGECDRFAFGWLYLSLVFCLNEIMFTQKCEVSQ